MPKFYAALITFIVIAATTIAQPTISNFTPISADPGESVTINGSGFDAIASNNKVFFGGIEATILSGGSTQLIVEVPVGGITDFIRVLNSSNLYAESKSKFVPTFTYGHPSLTATSFSSAITTATGTSPERLDVVDIDGDGLNDILVTRNSGNFYIYQNSSTIGSVSLTQLSFSQTFNSFQPLLTRDLDGDGKPDIIAFGFNGIDVRRNTSTPGTISFDVVQQFSVSSQESPGLEVADLDGDGKLDVIAPTLGGLRLFRNTSTPGSISFASEQNIGNTGTGVAAADLDEDGLPEIVVASSGVMRILKNNSTVGSLSFTAQPTLSGTVMSEVELVDIDLDGKVDIIGFSPGNQTVGVRVFRNTSSGSLSFVVAQTIASGSGGASAGGFHIGDINGDERPDVIVTRGPNSSLGVYLNNSTPGNVSLNNYFSYSIGTVPYDAFAADIDGDNKSDLIATNRTANTFTVILNNVPATTPVISANSISATTLEPGETTTLNFGLTGVFYYDNNITVELSDNSGSFASPTIVGTSTAYISGNVNFTIPSSTPAGNYKVRLTSDRPGFISNELDIVIFRTFYSQSSGAFDVLTRWNTDPSGAGVDASTFDFSDGASNFVVQGGNDISAPSSDLNINNLTIESTGSLEMSNINLTVNGITQLDGTLSDIDQSVGSRNTYVGNFIIGTTGILNSVQNCCFNVKTHEFQNGITNDGTFLIDLRNQSEFNGLTDQTIIANANIDLGNVALYQNVELQGSANINLGTGGNLTLNSATITNNNTGQVSIIGDLYGDGQLINGIGSTLRLWYANKSASITLDASSANNTVNYYRNGDDQPIFNTPYHHITFDGLGTKTLENDILVNGNLTINTNPTLIGSTYNITINGTWDNNNGTAGFTPGTSTVTFNASGVTSQNIFGSTNFYNLTIDNTSSSGQVVMANDFTISNQLTLTNGNISLSANSTLYFLNSSSAVSGTFSNARMIKMTDETSFVRKYFDAIGSFDFPIGTTGAYTPASISLASGTTFGSTSGSRYVEVSVVNSEEPNVVTSGLSLTKYWTLSSANLSNITGSLDFNYDDSEIPGTSDENLYVNGYYNGASWEVSNGVSPASNSGVYSFTNKSSIDGDYSMGEPQAFFSISYSDLTISASNMFRNSTHNVLYSFQINSSASIDFIGLNISTLGTFTGSDLNGNGIKLYYNTINSIGGATQFGSGLTGTGSFSDALSMATTTDYYFFITADLSGTAIHGNTISVNSITPIFSAGSISATPISGVDQTIAVPALGVVADSDNGIAGEFDNVGYFYGQAGTTTTEPIGKWNSQITHRFSSTTATNNIIRGVAIDHNLGEIYVGLNARKYRITDGALITTTYNFGRDAAVDATGGLIYTQNADLNLYRNGAVYVDATTFNTYITSTGNIRGLFLSGNTLWVGTSNAELHKIDIADVANPVLLESYDFAVAGNVWTVSGGNFEDITGGDKKLLYIASRNSSQVIAFNTETGVANVMLAPGFSPIVLAMGPNGEMVTSQFTSNYYPINNLLDTRSDMGTPPTLNFGGDLAGTTLLSTNATDQILVRFSVTPSVNDGALYEFIATATFGGSADISNLSNYKLWYKSNDSDITGATELTGVTININGDNIEVSDINHHINLTEAGYFWLTSDITFNKNGTIQIDPSSIVSSNTYGHGVLSGAIANTPLIDMTVQPFITTWVPTDNDIVVPHNPAYIGSYSYDFILTNISGTGGNASSSGVSGGVTITGLTPGDTYQLEITGDFPAIYFNGNTTPASELMTIEQWGDISWQSMNNAFNRCQNLTITATDAPDLSTVTDMTSMFQSCNSLTGDFTGWDVSNVQNMSSLFSSAIGFDEDISGWDVSSVTNMSHMFDQAQTFNQAIGSWDVSNVQDMSFMFFDARLFNQAIGIWNVGSVTDMSFMFEQAYDFNQPIDSWNVSAVTNMAEMFTGAISFNQPLNSWVVSSVTDMNFMFNSADAFNQPLDNWDVSGVTDMSYMFEFAVAFDQSLAAWDVSIVNDMSGMLDNSSLSILNYDATLSGWAALPTLMSGVNLGAAGLFYCDGALDRANIESTYVWNITGDTEDCSLLRDIFVYQGADPTGTQLLNNQSTAINFGTINQGSTSTITFTIDNPGLGILDISSIDFSISGYSTDLISLVSVPASGFINFTLTLTGAAQGTFTGTATINSNDADEPAFIIPITGIVNAVVAEPEIDVIYNTTSLVNGSASINFGTIDQGSLYQEVITINNIGTSNLTISSISPVIGTNYSVDISSTVVSPSASVDITITLDASTSGILTDQISISNDDSDENPYIIDLTSDVTPVSGGGQNIGITFGGSPLISGTSTIDFGSTDIGTNVTQTVIIENTGTDDLVITNIQLADGTVFTLPALIFSITLAPGETLNLSLILDASSAGLFEDQLIITSNDLDAGSFEIGLLGEVVGNTSVNIVDITTNQIIITGQDVDLGQTNINVSVDKNFGIENLSSTEVLQILSITVDNPVFEIINAPTSIDPNVRVEFTIRLQTNAIGIHTGIVTVITNINNFSFGVIGEVLSEGDPPIIVYNVVTPNGDGIHDFFKIVNIESYPSSNVSIFDRWGGKVFETSNYNNTSNFFNGISDSGDELITGNYYYFIDKGNGDKPERGFIFLKR